MLKTLNENTVAVAGLQSSTQTATTSTFVVLLLPIGILDHKNGVVRFSLRYATNVNLPLFCKSFSPSYCRTTPFHWPIYINWSKTFAWASSFSVCYIRQVTFASYVWRLMVLDKLLLALKPLFTLIKRGRSESIRSPLTLTQFERQEKSIRAFFPPDSLLVDELPRSTSSPKTTAPIVTSTRFSTDITTSLHEELYSPVPHALTTKLPLWDFLAGQFQYFTDLQRRHKNRLMSKLNHQSCVSEKTPSNDLCYRTGGIVNIRVSFITSTIISSSLYDHLSRTQPSFHI